MLAIARALLTNPSQVLLDEPSEGLAPAVADQVAVMEKGRIIHRDSTPDFRRDPDTAHRLLGVA